MVVLGYRDLTTEALLGLIDHGWRFAVLTDSAYLLLSPRLAARVPDQLYTAIFPAVNMPVTAANAVRVLTEAERACRTCPAAASFAWVYQAETLRLLSRPAESQAAQRHIPAQLILE